MIYLYICGTMLIFCIIMQIADYVGVNTGQIDKFLYAVYSVLLIVLAVIRENIGLDYSNYEAGFLGLHRLSESFWAGVFAREFFEPLFNLINLLLPSFRAVVAVCAVLGILTKIIYFGRTNTKLFCLFLYYCSVYLYYDMGIMRQGISISIVWYALSYVKKKECKKFFISIMVASMFHLTALLAIPIYFIGNRRYRLRFYAGILALSVVVSGASVVLERLVIAYGPPYIAHKMVAYTTYLYTDSGIRTLLPTVIIRLFILCSLWYALKKMERRGAASLADGDWLYINAFFISIAEMVAFSSFFIMATRGTASLYFCYIPLFSILVSNKKNARLIRLFIFAASVMFVLNTFTNTLFRSAGGLYLPYTTIFN